MQQLLSTAQQIMEVLNGVTVKTKEIEKEAPIVTEHMENFRQLERLALRWLSISRHMGLPENMARATETISTLIVMVRMLEISVSQMMKGPVGVLIGVAGLVGVALTAYDMTRGGS